MSWLSDTYNKIIKQQTIVFINGSEVEFIKAPVELQNGGWYGGRQYFEGRFGEPGVIITGKKKLPYKEITNIRVFERR